MESFIDRFLDFMIYSIVGCISVFVLYVWINAIINEPRTALLIVPFTLVAVFIFRDIVNEK